MHWHKDIYKKGTHSISLFMNICLKSWPVGSREERVTEQKDYDNHNIMINVFGEDLQIITLIL